MPTITLTEQDNKYYINCISPNYSTLQLLFKKISAGTNTPTIKITEAYAIDKDPASVVGYIPYVYGTALLNEYSVLSMSETIRSRIDIPVPTPLRVANCSMWVCAELINGADTEVELDIMFSLNAENQLEIRDKDFNIVDAI